MEERERPERKFSTTNTLEAAYLIYCGVKPSKQTRKPGSQVRMHFNITRKKGRYLIRSGLYAENPSLVNARSFARALYAVHGYNQVSMRRETS